MIKRLIEKQIIQSMKDFPSVTIYGPRQCGKTTTVRNLFPDFSYANLEDMNVRRLAFDDPEGFFARFPEPVIIDEIQRVPELISAVQIRIDKTGKKGQYVLTGSQQIALKAAVSQSLAGRTAVLNMLPLSVKELVKEGIVLDRDTQLLAGNMPYLYANKGISPSEYYKSYIETYLGRDIAMQNQVHDMMSFERMLHLLASRVGQLLNESSLASDTGISTKVIKGWLSILEATHIIYFLKPWYSSRTNQEVKTPKIYFCDTGIAAYLLGIETPAQMNRDPLMGQLFGNMIIMEALKAEYDNNTIDSLFFFRNSNGKKQAPLPVHESEYSRMEFQVYRTTRECNREGRRIISLRYPLSFRDCIEHQDILLIELELSFAERPIKQVRKECKLINERKIRIILFKCYLFGCHPRDFRNLFLQTADSGFAGVLVDDVRKCRLVYPELLLVQPMLFKLSRDEVVFGYAHLLFGEITGHGYHLHPVAQGGLDGGCVVGRGDEKHMRQVVVDVKVVVVERGVLLRVKGFQQG